MDEDDVQRGVFERVYGMNDERNDHCITNPSTECATCVSPRRTVHRFIVSREAVE
jgi:hypothetical protein